MKYTYIKHGDAVDQVRRLSNTATYEMSGPDAFIGDFLRKHLDDDVLVLCKTNQDSRFESGRIFAQSFNENRYGVGRVAGRMISALQMGRALFKWRPDRILCGCSGEMLWISVLVAKVLGVPIVNSRHGELQDRRGVAGLVAWLDRFCICRCDSIVCHGPYMADQIRALGFDESKLFEFEVDLSEFAKSDDNFSIPDALSNFVASHKFIITFIGRVQHNKGIFDLLSAFSKLRDLVNGVGLAFVGEGDDSNKLREQVEKSDFADNVLLMGKVEHNLLPNIIRNSTLILAPTQPSFPEGRCMVVLESLVLEVPVIVPNFGPFPYAVNDDVNGLLFDPGSELSLFNKLKCVLMDQLKLESLRCGAAVTSRQLLQNQTSFGDAVHFAFKSASL